LAAADGVMSALEQADIGHQTGRGRIPIVPAAVVFDRHVGDENARPSAEMGAEATRAALAGAERQSGNVGAGCGVTAGKFFGPSRAMKSGMGNAGIETPDGLQIAALTVVNPVGNVRDTAGKVLAGARKSAESREIADPIDLQTTTDFFDPLHSNTTLAVLGTNAKLSRIEAQWVAEQSIVAMARQIEPPFTRHDGDVVFAASVGDFSADLHRVGLLCRQALSSALIDACVAAESVAGLWAHRDLS
jgi:L-aminopeptidase/D-esterase-like protein